MTCLSVVVVVKIVIDTWLPCQVNNPSLSLQSPSEPNQDDKMLMVWDLDPALDIASVPSPGSDASSSSSPRPQPTAYVITFPHPLTTVNSHPSTGKDFLVSDCRGSIFITDWRSDPDESDQGNWRHSNLVELVEPCALSDAMTGLSVQWTGSAAWRRDAVDM